MSLYAWGFGKTGQLGNLKKESCETPQEVKVLKAMTAASLATGLHFTAFVTHDGKLFTFGCGKYGRLGTNKEEDSSKPLFVEALGGYCIKQVREVDTILAS